MGVNGDDLEGKDLKWHMNFEGAKGIPKGSEHEAVQNDSEVCLQCGAVDVQHH